METIREILKNQTLKDHMYMEEKFQIVLSPKLDLKTYLSVLKKLYSFHLYFEKNLEEAIPSNQIHQEYLNSRKKSQWLEKDIEILSGYQDFKNELNSKNYHFKDFNNVSSLMGAMYVLEGATLGGQIITKKLRENSDLKIQEATSFYSAYGDQTGLMWRKFLANLEGLPWDSYRKEKALEGAKAIFKDIDPDF